MNRVKMIFSSTSDELMNDMNNLVIKFKNYFKSNMDIYVEFIIDDKVKVNHPKYKYGTTKDPNDDSIHLLLILNPKEKYDKARIKSYVYKLLIMFLVLVKKPKLDVSREKLFNVIQEFYSNLFGITNICRITNSDISDLDEFTKGVHLFSRNIYRDINKQVLFSKCILEGIRLG